MPPLVPRKRLRDDSPTRTDDQQQAKKKPTTTTIVPRKATLYDDLDGSVASSSSKPKAPIFIHGDDSDSSLTSLSDEEFEDVPLPTKTRRANESDSDDDDDIEFEDVEAPAAAAPDAPITSGDLELTLNRDTRISLTNPFGEKKGPSKRERKVRNATHCIHVLSLLWHNAVRNSWLCDPELQAIMVSHIPPKLWDYIDRWRRNSGLVEGETPSPKANRTKSKGQSPAKSKYDSRDWSKDAIKLEDGAVDMSHGDPLFRLMQTLMSWWKQRFRVTSPGIRKLGYMSLERLDRICKAHAVDGDDATAFGERIRTLEEFRKHATTCGGSRDVGAQLFTALLRGLGIESRMVANLQCLGFGWSRLEDADPEEDGPEEKAEQASTTPSKISTPKADNKKKKKTPQKPKVEQDLFSEASVDSGLELEYSDSDEASVVEVKVRVTPKKTAKTLRKADYDLEFPHYWTEALSPVTNKYLAIDVICKGIVATNRDLIESLEPRGSKADKVRQVIAYTVGYSSDGTAKDVTVRYLRKKTMPGRTKGMRMPIEKIPIYNHHGKVKRYEAFDWFKVAMSGYRRGDRKHPITEIDELEDSTCLKASKPEEKVAREGAETLQYYKQSKDFVLARHLKREEALKPTATAVKKFKNKGKGGNIEEEDVFLRSDVVNVKSAETWHKQGRAPLPGEQPLKRVPYRAATLNRKRVILEAEAATGQKVLQGLFSFDQTDWIIPPPIQNGIIPKNEYGNIDLFVEHMCPQGAIHVPFRGAGRICKRLGIDYAEAVVDFEFGHRMAVPVIQGVVIPEEYHTQIMEELQQAEAERIRKEDEKRRKAALGKWRKFIMGLRIVERIKLEYGHIEDVSVFGQDRRAVWAKEDTTVHDEDMAGGFLPEGYEEMENDEQPAAHTTSSFFPVVDEDDQEGDDDLILEDPHSKPSLLPSAGDDEILNSGDGQTSDDGIHISLATAPKVTRKKSARKAVAGDSEMRLGSRRSQRQKEKVSYDENAQVTDSEEKSKSERSDFGGVDYDDE